MLSFTVQNEAVPRGTGAAVKRAIPENLLVIAREWHHKYLAMHFKGSAPSRYLGVYQPRKESYLKKKQRKKGHQLPLVWSGNLMKALQGMVSFQLSAHKLKLEMAPPYDVGASSGGVLGWKKAVWQKGPHWMKGFMSFWKGRATLPHYDEEVTAINEEEAAIFTEMFSRGIMWAIGKKLADKSDAARARLASRRSTAAWSGGSFSYGTPQHSGGVMGIRSSGGLMGL